MKNRFLHLCTAAAFVLTKQPAAAQERLVRFGTDALPNNAFTENPAAYLPKEQTVGVEVGQRSNPHSLEVTGANPSLSEFQVDQNRTNLALISPSGNAFAFGLTGMIDNRIVESNRLRDFERRVLETFQTSDIGLQLAIGVTDKARVGLALKYRMISANILGSFGANENDRTKYSGTLTGYGAGVLLGDKAASLGVSYMPPIKGKAKVEGESKVLVDPGIGVVEAAFELNPTLKVGGAVRKWNHKRDDRAKVSTSPTNQTQIILNGIDLERDLLPDQEVQVGMDFGGGAVGGVSLRLAVTNQQSEFVTDPDKVPGEKNNSDNRMSSYIGTAAIEVAGQRSDFQGGMSASQRKLTTRSGANERAYQANERTFFVAITLGM